MIRSHESSEDYLERILMIRQQKGQVRSIDIVNSMNYSKPSISIAMKKLRESGMVVMDDNGYITLTETGQQVAEKIYQRHLLLTKVLAAIGVDKDRAEEQACRIEHDIDDDTYEKIGAFYRNHFEEE